jgi:hypothetical protein
VGEFMPLDVAPDVEFPDAWDFTPDLYTLLTIS